jgi:hypothetical protein
MSSLRATLLAISLVLVLTSDIMGQYRVVPSDEDEYGHPQWQLQKIGPSKDTIRIPLEKCRMELGLHPAYVVVGNTLFGCNFDYLLLAPGSRGPYNYRFAAYAIEDKALKLTELLSYQVPDFKRKDYREDFEVQVEKTKFILIYKPFTKYGGAVIFDCAYYEPGDGERLYKRFLAMVKQYAKVNPDQKHHNPKDQI